MEQSRKKFLRQFFIGATSVPLILQACKKEDLTTDTDTGTGSGSGSGSGSCSVSPSETAGPFPTITPSSLVRSDIKDDRTGVAFTIKITIKNTNNSCAALANAIVDIWHCDKDGYYSEYGGTSMQSVNYTAVHFLRGRQTTDSNGLVTFTSIFPGWYQSRATHIHLSNAKPILTLMPLKKVLEKLPADKFRRIHRSYIVAIEKVNSILNRKVQLSSSTELPISDSYSSFIREWKK